MTTSALGRQRHLNLILPECLLSEGDLNRSMQHLHSSLGEGDVENEATTQDLLQLRTKKLDVGSLAER